MIKNCYKCSKRGKLKKHGYRKEMKYCKECYLEVSGLIGGGMGGKL